MSANSAGEQSEEKVWKFGSLEVWKSSAALSGSRLAGVEATVMANGGLAYPQSTICTSAWIRSKNDTGRQTFVACLAAEASLWQHLLKTKRSKTFFKSEQRLTGSEKLTGGIQEAIS